MAILVAGTSLAEFQTEGTFSADTTASRLAPYVAEGIATSAVDAFSLIKTPAPVSSLWLKLHINLPINANGDYFVFRAGSTPVFKIARILAAMTAQRWDGSAWVTVGSTFSDIATGRARFDMKFVGHGSEGEFLLYRDKTLLSTITGNTGGAAVDTIEIRRPGGTNFSISAVIVADEDTRPLEYAQIRPTGAGAVTEWMGSAADVSNAAGFNDSTFMSTDVADQRHTFAMPSLHADFNTGWSVVSLFGAARAVVEAGKAGNLRLMARNSTDESFAAQASLTSTPGIVRGQFTVDPNTSAAWTIAGINAAEIGVQSRAP